ncbi:MAG: thioredoxin family protein [Chloroflexi bacterium]|nr:thioredoxin family protein [Chloroflexota bacterium]
MIDRILIAAALLSFGIVAWQTVTRRQLARARRTASVRDPLLATAPHGASVIVYFTTPTCAPCKFQQTPTLDALQGELGDQLHIVRVDATAEPEAAARWGVFSVPTLFVLDSDGTPKHVHNGVVSGAVLKRQLATA